MDLAIINREAGRGREPQGGPATGDINSPDAPPKPPSLANRSSSAGGCPWPALTGDLPEVLIEDADPDESTDTSTGSASTSTSNSATTTTVTTTTLVAWSAVTSTTNTASPGASTTGVAMDHNPAVPVESLTPLPPTDAPPVAPAPAPATAPSRPLGASDYAKGMLGLAGGAAQVVGGLVVTGWSGGLAAPAGSALVSSGTSSLIYTAKTLFYEGKPIEAGTYLKEAGIGGVTGLIVPNLGQMVGFAKGPLAQAGAQGAGKAGEKLAGTAAGEVLGKGMQLAGKLGTELGKASGVLGKGLEKAGQAGVQMFGETAVKTAAVVAQGAGKGVAQGTAGAAVNNATTAAFYWYGADDEKKKELKQRLKDSFSPTSILQSAAGGVAGPGLQVFKDVAGGVVETVAKKAPALGQVIDKIRQSAASGTPQPAGDKVWDYVCSAGKGGAAAVASGSGMAGAKKMASNVWNNGSLEGAGEGGFDSMVKAGKQSLVDSAISGATNGMSETAHNARQARDRALRDKAQRKAEKARRRQQAADEAALHKQHLQQAESGSQDALRAARSHASQSQQALQQARAENARRQRELNRASAALDIVQARLQAEQDKSAAAARRQPRPQDMPPTVVGPFIIPVPVQEQASAPPPAGQTNNERQALADLQAALSRHDQARQQLEHHRATTLASAQQRSRQGQEALMRAQKQLRDSRQQRQAFEKEVLHPARGQAQKTQAKASALSRQMQQEGLDGKDLDRPHFAPPARCPAETQQTVPVSTPADIGAAAVPPAASSRTLNDPVPAMWPDEVESALEQAGFTAEQVSAWFDALLSQQTNDTSAGTSDSNSNSSNSGTDPSDGLGFEAWLEEAQRPGTMLNTVARQQARLAPNGTVPLQHHAALWDLRRQPGRLGVACAQWMRHQLDVLEGFGSIAPSASPQDRLAYALLARRLGLAPVRKLMRNTMDAEEARQLLIALAGAPLAEEFLVRHEHPCQACLAWLMTVAHRRLEASLGLASEMQ